MDKRSQERFTNEIRDDLFSRYGLTAQDCEPLAGFESFIYRYMQDDERFVLRIGHSIHRSPGEVLGEIEFVNYLARHGISVPRVLPSRQDALLETIGDGHDGEFHATRFSWAPGVHVWETEYPKDELFANIGRMTGTMHALTKDFRIETAGAWRPSWDGDDDIDLAGWLPKSDRAVIDRYNELSRTLAGHPRHRDNFGLIHFDFHGGNYFVDGENITLFDFDDSLYHYFAADLAMEMFYAVSHDCRSDEQLAAAGQFKALWRGYTETNRLDPAELKWLPLLIEQREILLYGVLHRSMDPPGEDGGDSWSKSYMKNRREKILEQVPYLDLDFQALASEVSEEP
jgi:Ser/Thr protein kinase RdoA (MazF antagonist)